MEQFTDNDIGVLMASVDDKDKMQGLAHKFGLTMPLAYGLDAEAASRELGCFFDEDDGFLHATGFIVKPDGTLLLSAYSSGPVGRITAGDALSIIRYLQTEDASHLPST